MEAEQVPKMFDTNANAAEHKGRGTVLQFPALYLLPIHLEACGCLITLLQNYGWALSKAWPSLGTAGFST